MDRIGRIFPWNRELDLGMILILLIVTIATSILLYIIFHFVGPLV